MKNKRILSFFLTIVLLFSLLMPQAYAASDILSGMKVKELMDSLKGDCYRFRVHYPEEWEFGLITGATFFGKRGLVLQHGEDDVSSFTLNPSWLSCEDETQRCIMVEISLEP